MNGKAPATIKDLQKLVVKFRDARDWKQFHNPKDMALSLVLEATEVLEHFQWKNGKVMDKHIAENGSKIGDELSDVLYWILLMANDLKIDLPKIFIEKMKENDRKYPVAKAKGRSTKYTDL